MATMAIRTIDCRLEARLRARSARSGRSIEDEARDILQAAPSDVPEPRISFHEAILARIEPFGGVT